MNETREELLQNLNYVKNMLAQMSSTLTQYMDLERNFRTMQNKIGVDGVKNKTKLLAMTIGFTVGAFFLLITVFWGGIAGVIPYIICAYIIYAYRNRKSLLKKIAIFILAAELITMAVNMVINISIVVVIVVVVLMAIVVVTEYFVITSKNKNADEYNSEVKKNNEITQNQRNYLLKQYKQLMQELNQNTMAWFPPDYYNISAVDFFISAVRNSRVETVKEMVNLFEQTEQFKRMEEFECQKIQQYNQMINDNRVMKKQLSYVNMMQAINIFQLSSINSSIRANW